MYQVNRTVLTDAADEIAEKIALARLKRAEKLDEIVLDYALGPPPPPTHVPLYKRLYKGKFYPCQCGGCGR